MKRGQNIPFADTLPPHFRRACSAMSGDGGLRAFLDERYGAGKWIVSVTPPTTYQRDAGVEIAIDNHDFAAIAVEYGYQRLAAVFASLDPVAAAAPIVSNQQTSEGT